MKACWPGLAIIAGLLSPSCGGFSPAKSRWESWSSLQFDAKGGVFFSGRVELTLSDTPGGRRLETEATASFLGATIARSWTESVFDGATGRTTSHRSHSPKRGDRYLFSSQGYTVEKLRPPAGREAPFDEWEVTSRKEFPFPALAGVAVQPYDYYGMLIRLRELALNDPGDEVVVYVATARGPQQYRVQVAERRTRDRTYSDLTTGEQKTEALEEFRLRIVPEDRDGDEGFLGMEGDIEIWVEAKSKTPLEISGRVPKVPGRVQLLLTVLG